MKIDFIVAIIFLLVGVVALIEQDFRLFVGIVFMSVGASLFLSSYVISMLQENKT